ncbi:MAG: flavodoxin family protein [Candidatus Hodarchaeota archaeon]
MKVLVTYRSRTGNTKKIAEVIYNEIKTEKEIRYFKKAENLDDYDFSFVGFPMENLGPAKSDIEWLQKHVNGKKIGLFCTHASPEGMLPLQSWLDNIKNAAVNANAEIIGFFHCQGEMSQQIADVMAKSEREEFRQWAQMRDMTLGQPDETRIEAARIFARETMEKV